MQMYRRFQIEGRKCEMFVIGYKDEAGWAVDQFHEKWNSVAVIVVKTETVNGTRVKRRII